MSTKKKYPRPKHSDETLKHSWRHIYYEHEMLETTADWLIENLDTNVVGYEFAIHMESFLIHARNLNQFYYAQAMHEEEPQKHPRPKNNDLIADDYCEGMTAWNPPPENRLPDTLILRIHKRLAHLTYQRSIGKRNDYDYADILRKVESVRDAFLKVAPSARLDLSEFNFWYLPCVFAEE
jgi:hypothetical protein